MKKIRLPGKKYSKFELMVDDDIYDLIKDRRLYIIYNINSGKIYVSIKYLGRRIVLHRIILKAGRNKIVDFKDGNTLNCTRENLFINTFGRTVNFLY